MCVQRRECFLKDFSRRGGVTGWLWPGNASARNVVLHPGRERRIFRAGLCPGADLSTGKTEPENLVMGEGLLGAGRDCPDPGQKGGRRKERFLPEPLI